MMKPCTWWTQYLDSLLGCLAPTSLTLSPLMSCLHKFTFTISTMSIFWKSTLVSKPLHVVQWWWNQWWWNQTSSCPLSAVFLSPERFNGLTSLMRLWNEHSRLNCLISSSLNNMPCFGGCWWVGGLKEYYLFVFAQSDCVGLAGGWQLFLLYG